MTLAHATSLAPAFIPATGLLLTSPDGRYLEIFRHPLGVFEELRGEGGIFYELTMEEMEEYGVK